MRPVENEPGSNQKVHEVVELSIAASEAVVIHEIVSGLVSDSLLASTVLEAASRLKESRLDVFKETCCSGSVSNVEYLSDLEDSSMAGAYGDVGLSIACSANHQTDNISSPEAKENLSFKYDMDGRQAMYLGTRQCLNVESHRLEEATNTCTQLEDAMKLDTSCTKEHNRPLEDLLMCLGSTNSDCRNQVMHYSVQDNLHSSAYLKELDCEVEEDNHRKESVRHSPVWTFKGAGEHLIRTSVTDYQLLEKREEMKSSDLIEHRFSKVIPGLFTDATSFLSESADLAPDMNSFVQKQAADVLLASQLSTGTQVIYNKSHETLLSEDILGCLSLPSIDPLCSVVPCSISCDNTSTNPALDHDLNFCTHRNSTSSIEYPRENKVKATTACAEESGEQVTHLMQPTVYRCLTSSRPYTGSFHGQSYYESLLNKTSFQSLVNDFQKETCKTEEDAVKPPPQRRKEKDSPILKRRFQDCLRTFRDDVSVQEKSMVQNTVEELLPVEGNHMLQSTLVEECTGLVPRRKRVRFIESEANCIPKDKAKRPHGYFRRTSKCLRYAKQLSASRAFGSKRGQVICYKDQKRMLFRKIEFLLSGFSNRKEKKLEILIRKYSGVVLSDIPAFSNSRFRRPSEFDNMIQVVISPKKLQTIKFLYGCAVNAFLLKECWITDSIAADSLLPPERYSILPKLSVAEYSKIRKLKYNHRHSIFRDAGIYLHGNNSFCVEMAKIIEYGGGQVFNSLQALVDGLDSQRISFGAIVAESESSASRHLKHCAMERKTPMLPTYWIIKSLHKGKLLPCEEQNKKSPSFHAVEVQDFCA